MILPLRKENCLRWMFLDFNSYFASIEQIIDPSLLGKPIAVCPTQGDSGTVIAASYEAKKFGVYTGTKAGDAKRMCPGIILIPATHSAYQHFHENILKAVEQVLPIDKVCSVDEMRFRLLGEEREPENAKRIALQMKQAIYDNIAPSLGSSVGVAPNAYLAKLATDLQKPNGLVFIEPHELPDRLKGLSLMTFCGINRRMKARLNAQGIFTSDDLVAASPEELKKAFGSVLGERWWYIIRGYDILTDFDSGKSLGHSHVLAPELRNDADCRAVLLRLAHKACARLRAEDFWASYFTIYVRGRISWSTGARIAPSQDAISISKTINRLWAEREFSQPTQVGITFYDLKKSLYTTASLFENTKDFAALGHTVDRVNNKFGKNSVYLAAIHNARNHASEKLAFAKTTLFSEGKDDHAWPDTFRGGVAK